MSDDPISGARDDARRALEAARERVAARLADDEGIWWRSDGTAITTHLLRRDGSWSLFLSDGETVTEVAEGEESAP